MALVDYPSSEDESQSSPSKLIDCASSSSVESPAKINTTFPSHKRKHPSSSSAEDLPPLPSAFHSLYASTVRTSTSDDSTLHGGRKRVTPHIEGNWPSHVYIEWYPSKTQHTNLSNLISKISETASVDDDTFSRDDIQTFLTSELGVPLPLHISLSRPIGFLTEKKDAFLSSLEHGIKTCGVRPFKVKFSTLDWVSNHEKTRWFLVLRLLKPTNNDLNKLLHTTNNTVQAYGQLPLYTPPTLTLRSPSNKPARNWRSRFGNAGDEVAESIPVPDMTDAFHFSIAWSLGEPSEGLRECTRRVAEEGGFAGDVLGVEVDVVEVKVKIGNVVTGVSLVREREGVEGGGLFGI